MSLSPQEVNSISIDPIASEDAEIVNAHLSARAAERRILLQCSLIGLIGVTILVAIIAGHAPDTTQVIFQN